MCCFPALTDNDIFSIKDKLMTKVYTSTRLDQLKEDAASAKRRRSHLNVHAELDANVQRLFIATQPDTYMRPHRHPEAHKWEFFIVLQGKIDLLANRTSRDWPSSPPRPHCTQARQEAHLELQPLE